MELPPARLQGDDGAQRGLVPQDLPHYIHSHWLGLGEKSACTTTLFFLDNKPCTEDNVFPKSNFRNCVFKSVCPSIHPFSSAYPGSSLDGNSTFSPTTFSSPEFPGQLGNMIPPACTGFSAGLRLRLMSSTLRRKLRTFLLLV